MRTFIPRCRGLRRIAWTCWLGGALLPIGCANFNSRPTTAWHGLDPQAPLGAQEQTTRRPADLALPPDSIKKAAPESPTPKRTPAPLAGPRLNAEPPSGLIPRALQLEPDEATPSEGLVLSVSAPTRKQIGSHATYRVTVRNASKDPVANVAVECRFDEALVFNDSEKHRVVQKLDQLLPGEAKDLNLSLFSGQAGSHCCRFSVLTGEAEQVVEAATKAVCVEFVSRQLQVDVLGPTQRTIDSRAEFSFTLTNHSERVLTDMRALLSHDKALVPREASAGKQVKPGQLSWDLGTLQPNESIQLQVDFECHELARRACVTLEVGTAQFAPEQEEACVEIMPIAGTLDLQITDRDDPLEIGKTGQYRVTVRNIGLQPARQVALEAIVPDQLKVVSTKVLVDESELQVSTRQDQRRLIFDEIADLPADGRLTFLIDVEAVGAGSPEFRVRLSSSLSGTPSTAAEPTVVVEP